MKKSLLFLIIAIFFVINTSFVLAQLNVSAPANVFGEAEENTWMWVFAAELSDPTLNLSIEWDFGDGDTATGSELSYYNSVTEMWIYAIPHVYQQSQGYLAWVSVTNPNTGEVHSENIEVIVEEPNDPPVVIIDPAEIVIPVGDIVDFDASQTYDDHDATADLLYYWDADGDGTFEQDGQGLMNVQTQFNNSGDYTITLVVFDLDTTFFYGHDVSTPEWGMNTSIVHVNEGPIAEANGDYYSEFGNDIQFDSTGSYDPEG